MIKFFHTFSHQLGLTINHDKEDFLTELFQGISNYNLLFDIEETKPFEV